MIEAQESSRRPALALTDLLAIAAMFLLLAAMGVPTMERARELSKRMVCAVNLKGIGGAGAVYADNHNGQWMTPAFQQRTAEVFGIDYLCENSSSDDPGCVGWTRYRPSYSATIEQPSGGTPAVSTTRAFWMLVRSGDVLLKQFVCPSSQYDVSDPTVEINAYYDFEAYRNISYGYLVPFGPTLTRPRPSADNRIVFAADKGPFYYDINFDFQSMGPGGVPIDEQHAPSYWSPLNSRNHSQLYYGQGQNCLFVDGRVEFYRKPIAGIDMDNIYTLMLNEWEPNGFGRKHGDSPHRSAATYPFPGKEAFGPDSNSYSTTDSLIYP